MSCLQVLQNYSLTAQAIRKLLPQSLSLGDAATQLTNYLTTEAAACYQELIQQADYRDNWQTRDVQELMRAMSAADNAGGPSAAFKCIQVAAARVLGPSETDSVTTSAPIAKLAQCSQAVAQGHQQHMADTSQVVVIDAGTQQWHEIQKSLKLDDLTIEEARLLQSDSRRPLETLPGLGTAVLAVVLRKAR